MDPSLRRRDLDIVQLLARIQVYAMVQAERVLAARGGASASEGRRSPDDGHCVSPPHVPVPEVAAIVRLSFHSNHRQAICDLGEPKKSHILTHNTFRRFLLLSPFIGTFLAACKSVANSRLDDFSSALGAN